MQLEARHACGKQDLVFQLTLRGAVSDQLGAPRALGLGVI